MHPWVFSNGGQYYAHIVLLFAISYKDVLTKARPPFGFVDSFGRPAITNIHTNKASILIIVFAICMQDLLCEYVKVLPPKLNLKVKS